MNTDPAPAPASSSRWRIPPIYRWPLGLVAALAMLGFWWYHLEQYVEAILLILLFLVLNSLLILMAIYHWVQAILKEKAAHWLATGICLIPVLYFFMLFNGMHRLTLSSEIFEPKEVFYAGYVGEPIGGDHITLRENGHFSRKGVGFLHTAHSSGTWSIQNDSLTLVWNGRDAIRTQSWLITNDSLLQDSINSNYKHRIRYVDTTFFGPGYVVRRQARR